MDIVYPIVHILLYIAMWFAPPDVDRVSITCPDDAFELTRISGEWKFTSKEVSGIAAIKDGKAIVTVDGQVKEIQAASFIASAIGHDWTKQPKVTLQDQNTLEKTAAGFVLRTDDGKPGMKEYRITFHGPHKQPGGLSVNVLGAVKQPGVYQVAAGATVTTAIAAAGGSTEMADLEKARILRGAPGTTPEVIPCRPGPLRSGPNLTVIDHDTIYVPAKPSMSITDEARPKQHE